MYVLYSKTFGDATIFYEIGKKENKKGDGVTTTLGEFLKVIKYHAMLYLLSFLALQNRRHLLGG